MIIVSVPLDKDLHDHSSAAGKTWNEILNLVGKSPGYRRLYWARQVEKPENVQLHIGTHPPLF
jgi:hypothetical protein